MNKDQFNEGMLEFLQASPTPFHATANLGALLTEAGFEQLFEQDKWKLKKGGAYFVTRNDSAIVAFRTGTQSLLESGLALTGAHTDSPCLKVKPSPEIVKHGYVQLGVEVYGGALLGPWFDRDLSLAGRIDYQDSSGAIESCLINLERPVAIIPSLAIHLDRGVNDGKKVNPQTDLPPILMQVASPAADGEAPPAPFSFYDFLLETLRQEEEFEDVSKVLSYELSFYDTQAPALIGLEQEFIASARLDNLLSCYLCCMALIAGDGDRGSMMVCNDHEEVGSVSSSGAQGPFLRSVIDRMVAQETGDSDAFDRLISQSVLLSIDNAHGVHPNYADRHEKKHCPMLNAGPVIKINANQRYASNSNTIALFKSLCESQQVNCQSFVVRSDMGCGSTIGPISAAELGIATVDVGVPTFAMHSIRELAGSDDAADLFRVVSAFYQG